MRLNKPLKVLFNSLTKTRRCLTSPLHLFFILFTLYIVPVHANTLTALANISDSKSIVQDQRGYLWTAGIHGLTRFDGNKSIHFSKHSKKWPLPYTWINHLAIHDDKFLIATENQGAWIFDPLNGQSTKIKVDITDPSIYNAIYNKGSYYFYSLFDHSLFQYSLSNKTTQTIASNLTLTSLLKTEKNLYFSTLDSLYKISNDVPEKIKELPISSTTSLLKTLFVASHNQIFAYRDNGNQSSITLPENILILSTDHAKENVIVVMESGTIYIFNGKTLSPIEHGFEPIESHYINHIYQDSSGVLWISNNNGIQRVTENIYKNHTYEYPNKKLKSMYLHAAVLNDSLLVGTSGVGIYDFNGIKNLLPKNINDKFSPGGLKVMDMLTHKNSVFIATFDGLWQFNLLSQELHKLDIFPDNTILLSLKISKNKLYIGTDTQGFVIYDLKTQNILKHLNKKSGLSALEVIDSLPLNANTLWLATSKGIDVYNHLSNQITPVEKIGSSKIYSLTYADNKIFAATQSDGILVYNRQGILLAQFGQSIAFHSAVNIDGTIWAPSANGLYKIVPQTHQLSLVANTEKYTFSDTPIKLHNKIYIPHYEGILEVPTNTEKTFNAKVYISSTSISGTPYLQNSAIELASSNEIVVFELASLDYRLGQDKKFQYQINSGVWHQVYGNQLTLTGLASGTYRIKIKGTNSLGEWSNHHAFTEIKVAYPWYWSKQIRIAYIFIILFVSSLICWLLFLRFKSIKKIHDLLSEDIILRGKSSLNVTKTLSRAMKILEENPSDASDNLFNEKHNKKELHSLIQECIKELSSHSSTQEPDALYGKSLSDALPYFVEFIQKKYHIHCHLKNELNNTLLNYELQSDIYKIVYEAITAAILKGSNGHFSINLQEFKGKVWLTINDESDSFINYSNKINFDMSMYLIRQIASKNNASVNTFSDKSQGSQLLISFPLMNIS